MEKLKKEQRRGDDQRPSKGTKRRTAEKRPQTRIKKIQRNHINRNIERESKGEGGQRIAVCYILRADGEKG